jgi:ABC-type phosphate transport system auxiliary subunit
MKTLSIDLQNNYDQLNIMSELAGGNLKSAGHDLKNRLQELEAIKKRFADMIEQTADNISHQTDMLKI